MESLKKLKLNKGVTPKILLINKEKFKQEIFLIVEIPMSPWGKRDMLN